MMGFVWSWLLIGAVTALFHWYMVREAQIDKVINDDEADYLYKLTPVAILGGPLTVAYMAWVMVTHKDDD